jgi:AraC family transcriptional regulator
MSDAQKQQDRERSFVTGGVGFPPRSGTVKPTQRVIYANRIDAVLAHLALRLNEGSVPALGELASLARLSEFHFHRVFRLMTGETLVSMVRRLRIAMSLPVLATESASVVEATGTAAYATTQAYARALKAESGVSAASIRRDPEELAKLIERMRHGPARLSDERQPAPALHIEIVAFDPLRVVALRNVGAYAELNRGYGRLFELLPDPAAVIGLYGIPYDDPLHTPASECRFDCCVLLQTAPFAFSSPALRELRIGGGLCARVHHTGSYDLVWHQFDLLTRQVLEESDLVLSESPPFVHYYDDPDVVATEQLRADLYLPLVQES